MLQTNAISDCIFHIDLSSPTQIARAGGSISGGTGKFDRTKGMYFDGSSTYIEIPSVYALNRQFTIGGPTELSFVVEFYPDREDTESSLEFLWSSKDYASGSGFYVSRNYGASFRNWFLNGFKDVSISWLKGQRNVYVASEKSIDLNFYLNGVSVGSSTSNFSGVVNDGVLYLGYNPSYATSLYKGWIKSFSIYNRKLTEQEASDLYSQSTYRYRNEASLWLDMAEQAGIEYNIVDSANILVDGDMEDGGTTAWTPANNATLTKETGSPQEGNQCLRIAYNGTSNPQAYQDILTPGKLYHVTGYARSDGVGLPRVDLGGAAVDWVGSTSTSWQRFDFAAKCDSASGKIYLQNIISSAGYVEFDNVSVIETANFVADGDMEAVDTSAWTGGNDATLSKETTNPHGGSQVLRITRTITDNPYAKQTIFTAGKRYRVTGYARSDGVATPRIRDGTSGSYMWVGSTSTSWQEFDVVYTPSYSDFVINSSSSSNEYVEFDDIVIHEIEPLTLDKSRYGRNLTVNDAKFLNPGFSLAYNRTGLSLAAGHGLFNEQEMSVVQAFAPDFAARDSVSRFLFSCGQYVFSLWHRDVSISYALRAYWGGNSIDIAVTTYEQYWKKDGVNVMCISANQTEQKIYLNGVEIGSRTGSYTPSDDILYVGHWTSAAFTGNLYHFSTYPQALTPTQIADITSYLMNKYGGK